MNQIAIMLNLSVNPRDIKLFQTTTTISYEYENGIYGHSSSLTLDIDATDLTTATVKSTLDGVERNWEVDYDTGYYKDTNRYTIFWIYVTNPMLSNGQLDTTKVYNNGVLQYITDFDNDGTNVTKIKY